MISRPGTAPAKRLSGERKPNIKDLRVKNDAQKRMSHTRVNVQVSTGILHHLRMGHRCTVVGVPRKTRN